MNCYQGLYKFIGSKEPTLKLNVDKDFENKLELSTNVKYFKKVVKPTEEELKYHKEYLKKNLRKTFLIKFFLI